MPIVEHSIHELERELMERTAHGKTWPRENSRDRRGLEALTVTQAGLPPGAEGASNPPDQTDRQKSLSTRRSDEADGAQGKYGCPATSSAITVRRRRVGRFDSSPASGDCARHQAGWKERTLHHQGDRRQGNLPRPIENLQREDHPVRGEGYIVGSRFGLTQQHIAETGGGRPP